MLIEIKWNSIISEGQAQTASLYLKPMLELYTLINIYSSSVVAIDTTIRETTNKELCRGRNSLQNVLTCDVVVRDAFDYLYIT